MKLFNKKILTLAVVSVLTSGTTMMAGTLSADEQALDLPPAPPGSYAARQTVLPADVAAQNTNAQNIMGSSVEMTVQQAEAPEASETSEAPEASAQQAAAPEASETSEAPEASAQQAEAPEASETSEAPEASAQQAESVDVPVTQPVIVSATAVPAKPQEPTAAEQPAPTQQQPAPPPQAQMMYAPPPMPMQAMPGYGQPSHPPMPMPPGYGQQAGNQPMPMMYPPQYQYMPMPRIQYIYVVPVMPRMLQDSQQMMYGSGQYNPSQIMPGQQDKGQKHPQDHGQNDEVDAPEEEPQAAE